MNYYCTSCSWDGEFSEMIIGDYFIDEHESLDSGDRHATIGFYCPVCGELICHE